MTRCVRWAPVWHVLVAEDMEHNGSLAAETLCGKFIYKASADVVTAEDGDGCFYFPNPGKACHACRTMTYEVIGSREGSRNQ